MGAEFVSCRPVVAGAGGYTRYIPPSDAIALIEIDKMCLFLCDPGNVLLLQRLCVILLYVTTVNAQGDTSFGSISSSQSLLPYSSAKTHSKRIYLNIDMFHL